MSASSSGSHSPTATPQVKPEFDMPLSGTNPNYQLTPDNKDEDLKEETADKDSRKREYNRLAQREFRRRRKEKIAKLEHAQNSQVTEQMQEIQWLRTQNIGLRHENVHLKTQLYGDGWQYNETLALPPVVPSSRRTPSISSSPSSMLEPTLPSDNMSDAFGGNILPMSQLALTSSMLPGALQAFSSVTNALPSTGMQSGTQAQQYPISHPAGSRNSPSRIPATADFSNTVSTSGASFQSLTIPLTISTLSSSSRTMTQQPGSGGMGSRRSSVERPNMIAICPADRVKASSTIINLFNSLIAEASNFVHPATIQTSGKHLQLLHNLSPTLPTPFRPTQRQLSTPHYYGVDLLPSPWLRDRLCLAGPDVSAAFLHEFDCLLLTPYMDEKDRLIIWGEDPWNEFAWEFSAEMFRRWGWLLGPVWAERANFWRRQRGAQVLPLPMEAAVDSLWGMFQQLQMGAFGGMVPTGHQMTQIVPAQPMQRQLSASQQLQQLQQQAMSQAQQLAGGTQQQAAIGQGQPFQQSPKMVTPG